MDLQVPAQIQGQVVLMKNRLHALNPTRLRTVSVKQQSHPRDVGRVALQKGEDSQAPPLNVNNPWFTKKIEDSRKGDKRQSPQPGVGLHLRDVAAHQEAYLPLLETHVDRLQVYRRHEGRKDVVVFHLNKGNETPE